MTADPFGEHAGLYDPATGATIGELAHGGISGGWVIGPDGTALPDIQMMPYYTRRRVVDEDDDSSEEETLLLLLS